MQLLVDRKVKKVMLKFLIYPSRTSSDEVIFGVKNLKFLKSFRKLPESFQEASRRCRVPSLRVLRPETRLTVYRAIAVVVGRQLEQRPTVKSEVGNSVSWSILFKSWVGRVQKALHYVSMQVLVDRKLKKDMLKFLIYSFRTIFSRWFLGSKNLSFEKNIEKSSRMVPMMFQAM